MVDEVILQTYIKILFYGCLGALLNQAGSHRNDIISVKVMMMMMILVIFNPLLQLGGNWFIHFGTQQLQGIYIGKNKSNWPKDYFSNFYNLSITYITFGFFDFCLLNYIAVKSVLADPILSKHPLISGHHLESLNFLPMFTVIY